MMEIGKKDIIIIISLFSVAFLIRVVGVSNVCMYMDEYNYWWKTDMILVNNWAPTAKVFDHSPPFLSYIGAVVTVLFGGELNTLRMISVIFGSLTVPFLYLFGKAMYDRKTGLLSALFLCFSAYHCLYSRIIMLEALTLFFITAFLYFFWLSQHSENDRKSIKYAIIAGAMMGLAFDAKYISVFLIPAVLAYVLWTKRFGFKALLDKRIILTFIFAFLFFLPLLVCLIYTGVGFHGMSFYAFERFEMETITSNRALDFPLDELLIRSMEKILEVLSWGKVILIPPWTELFLVSSFLLIPIIFFYYLPSFISREKRSSFLMITLLMLFVLLLGCAGYKHYLIYLFPFCYIMFSYPAVKSFERLKRENSYKNIFRIFIVLLIVIILFSSFITAVTSPYWDEGEYLWAKSGVEFIKSDVTKSGYEGHITMGKTTISKFVEYSIYLSGFNASTISVNKAADKYSGKLTEIDLEKIDILKPYYLIIEEQKYHYYFNKDVKKEIFKDYEMVFHSQNYPYACFVLKRKNVQPSELLFPTDGKDGKISQDMFKRSVLGVMKVGKIYTALVKVKNTGDSRTNFSVKVHSDGYTIFVEDNLREITLDKGSTRLLKFKIVSLNEYVGELPIVVDLFAKHEENETWRRVDSVSDYVYLIEK